MSRWSKISLPVLAGVGVAVVFFLLYQLQTEVTAPTGSGPSPQGTRASSQSGPSEAPPPMTPEGPAPAAAQGSPGAPAGAPAAAAPREEASPSEAGPAAARDAGSIRGKVLGPQGLPLEGAAVVARRQDTSLFGFASYGDSLGHAGTDAAGEYVLRGVAAGRDVHLFVIHKDHAPTKFTGVVVRANQETLVPNIFLRSGGALSGMVTGETGPMAGVEVAVAPFSSFSLSRDLEELRTRTDAQGRFRVERVPAGKVSVSVRGPDLAHQSRHEVDVQENQETFGIDFRVSAGKALVGVVTDDAGSLLDGVKVLASPVDFTSAAPGDTVTDRSGRFEIRNLSDGEYNVVASKKGYMTPERISAWPGTSETVIRLEPNGSIQGKVVDESSGRPVPRFTLRYGRSRRGRILGMGQKQDFEAPDGRFVLDDLEPGPYVLEASSPDHAVTESPEVEVSRRGSVTLTLALNHGGSLIGRVVAAKNLKPVAGATIVVMNNRFGSQTPFIILGTQDYSDRKTTTGPEGSFHVRNLSSGTFFLKVEHPEFAQRRVDEIAVERGRDTRLEDIELFVGGTVRGIVVGADGRPDTDAEIQVNSANPERPFDRRVSTDHQGAFELDKIPPGEYLVLPIKRKGKFDVMSLLTATGNRVLIEDGRVTEVSF